MSLSNSLMFLFFLVVPLIVAICDIYNQGSLIKPYKTLVILMAVLLTIMYCLSYHSEKRVVFKSEGLNVTCYKVLSSLMIASGIIIPLCNLLYEVCNGLDERVTSVYKFSFFCVFSLYVISLALNYIFQNSDKNHENANDVGISSYASYGYVCNPLQSLLSQVRCHGYSEEVVHC
ncbi:hypothetical protein [Ehrlichia canis]|uniref:Uncharacterized protein n=2 Tax=Ehrlichia canis TaxID=944 RepID=A0ACA6AVW8_EHRCJ|nr:hypothetical protein [Ehrlichia canis]AAZ68459.1 hypothetical protein Ecaj_0416 [Ehrlichia canis str. Jake]